MSEGQEPGEDSEAETAGVDVTLGVDATLIEEMLRLSPAERLRQNDRMATLAAKLRAAFETGATRWPNSGT
ncbi:MAG TPA: hypothetical protein VHK47_04425 [Polyangia bacterium]|nr:hypothetical protein [Polyangia bacterium]